MSYSKSIAERFALNFNGIALGIWEAATLLSHPDTEEKGKHKIGRLRYHLENLRYRAGLSDSRHLYEDEIGIDPEEYVSLLDRLERGDVSEVILEIKKRI